CVSHHSDFTMHDIEIELHLRGNRERPSILSRENLEIELREFSYSNEQAISAFAKRAGVPRDWSGGIPTEADRSSWVIPFHSKWLWPPLVIRASDSSLILARERFGAK